MNTKYKFISKHIFLGLKLIQPSYRGLTAVTSLYPVVKPSNFQFDNLSNSYNRTVVPWLDHGIQKTACLLVPAVKPRDDVFHIENCWVKPRDDGILHKSCKYKFISKHICYLIITIFILTGYCYAQDLSTQQQQVIQQDKKIQDRMASQISFLSSAWQTVEQSYVAGRAKDYSKYATKIDDLYSNDRSKKLEVSKQKKHPKLYYKAGDILFASILTAVNSDEPSPVLARVLTGPLNGSKIVGQILPSSMPLSGNHLKPKQALVLGFNVLNIPSYHYSIPITAVAINPETARTSIATSVDNKNLLKYGSFFSANFLAGLAAAVGNQSNVKIITGNGSSDVGGKSSLSSQDEILIALGKVGSEISKAIDFLAIPPTIKIAVGSVVGIILLEDLIVGEDMPRNATITVPTDFPNYKPGSSVSSNGGLIITTSEKAKSSKNNISPKIDIEPKIIINAPKFQPGILNTSCPCAIKLEGAYNNSNIYQISEKLKGHYTTNNSNVICNSSDSLELIFNNSYAPRADKGFLDFEVDTSKRSCTIIIQNLGASKELNITTNDLNSKNLNDCNRYIYNLASYLASEPNGISAAKCS